jgi:hypothetical protein
MNVATQQRDKVAAMAASNTRQALALARTIADPWFRCQALSIVAVHVLDRRTQKLAIQEAFACANELSDPNRIVTVSSWPIKALVLTGNTIRASAETERLLRIISAEGSPVRRADALRQLLGSVSGSSRDVVLRVAKEFAAACLAPLQSGRRNKKGESYLEECLPAIAQIDPEFAETILGTLTPARSERAAEAIANMKNVPLPRILPWPHFGATGSARSILGGG